MRDRSASVGASMGHPRRLVSLDVLRAVAIVLVMFHHPVFRASDSGFLRPIAVPVERFGWTGVDLFFIRSGFLIGGLLFAEIRRTSGLRAGRFLVRRAFKIWPAYFVFVAYGIARSIIRDHKTGRESLAIYWPNIAQIQNYFPTPMGHTWSLAVEEHFYLLLPAVILILLSFGRLSYVPWIAVGLVVASNLMRIWYRRAFHETNFLQTHLRIDTLFFGVALAYVYHYDAGWFPRLIGVRIALFILGLLMLSPVLILDGDNLLTATFGSTLLMVGYALILMAAVGRPGCSGEWRWFRPVAWVGLYSYSIYLWHIYFGMGPVQKRLSPYLHSHVPAWLGWVVCTAVYMAVAIVGGVIMAKVVEFPALRIRDRFFPREG